MTDVLSWEPLSPFGALVELDLAGPVRDDVQHAVSDLFLAQPLLLFRDQALDMAAQVAFSSWFGPVLEEGQGMLSLDRDTGMLGRSQITFHSDLEATSDPLLALCLHAVAVVDAETSTRFANGIAAARALPPDLRQRVAGSQALHVWPLNLGDRPLGRVLDDEWPGTAHPVLWSHPVTGEEILYVTEQQTNRIVGLDAHDSDHLLRELLDRLYDTGNVYEHFWRNGDLVMWDNRALQHARGDLSDAQTRVLQRVALGRPYAEDIRRDTPRFEALKLEMQGRADS